MRNRGTIKLMTLEHARSYFFSKEFESLSILNGKKFGVIVVIPKEGKQLDVPSFVKNCLQTKFDGYDLKDLNSASQDSFISDTQAKQIARVIRSSPVFEDTWYIVSETPDVALSIALVLCRVKGWNEMVTLGDAKINGEPNQLVFLKLCKQAGITCEFSRVIRALAEKYKRENPDDEEFNEPLSDKEEEFIWDQYAAVIMRRKTHIGDLA